MLTKKMMCFAFGVGVGMTSSYFFMSQNSIENKIACLKRKLKKLEKDMSNALDNLKPEQMQKYKSELETKYKEIKNKLDNLTIKDIKDSAQGTLSTIKQNITNLSNKISSLMNSSSSN